MAYYLETWDAVEMFCRIISKKHNIPIEDFQSNEVVLYWLQEYSRKNKSEILSKEITDNYKSIERSQINHKSGERNQEYLRFVYELGKAIRTSRSVDVEPYPYAAVMHYIGDETYKKRKRKVLKPFSPSDKQRFYEGKKFWIYWFDDLVVTDKGQSISHNGISRGLLELMPFGRAELSRYVTWAKGSKRIYSGIFQLMGNENYLAIKMKLKESSERDLRMLVYIGSSEFEIALGMAANVHEVMWARKVLIEPIKVLSEAILTEPEFYSKTLKNPNNEIIPEYVWKFFERKEKNKLLISKRITSIEGFWEWQNLKK